MTATRGELLLLTDHDVDRLAWQFLSSDYADDLYGDWPLDPRLHGFLRRGGLARIADDGDLGDIIVDRVMACIAVMAGRGGRAGASEPMRARKHGNG